MRDNRSLEQKIRNIVHESNRNTELRKKEPNVGRPTGDNKLAKQGQIKTKIIDEDKEWEKDSAAVKASTDKKFVSKMANKWGERGGAFLSHPSITGSDKREKKTVKEDSEYGMARNELETAKRAIDRLNAKMGKGEGELEAWVQSKITKAADYLDTVADYIESGSVKEEVIDEDTAVASVSTKDTPKEQPESKNKKKDDGKDLMEPGTIKGGKTEVDTEPTTDDRADDGKKINKNEKATKAANAQAGVKEETMNKTKHFGLPADLIAAVTEALKGDQHKIDANKNNKIDSHDFKLLRGKKKVEEEVEELDERDAGNKAKKDAAVASVGAANKDEKHLTTKGTGIRGSVADKIRGREVTSGKDRMKEEVESIEKLSKDTMKSYEETDPGFSEAELARIEEIANNIDEVVTARKLTPADKAARAKYLEGHAAKMAGMAHHAIKGDAKSFKARNTEHGDYSKEPSKMAGIGLDYTLTKQDTKR
jgi:hypothetical protein